MNGRNYIITRKLKILITNNLMKAIKATNQKESRKVSDNSGRRPL